LPQPQPPITRITHTLLFDELSPRDFERLCLWLVEQRVRHLDVVAMQIQRVPVGSGVFGNSSPPAAAVHPMKRYGVNLGGLPPIP
jgi:hypothetical protein